MLVHNFRMVFPNGWVRQVLVPRGLSRLLVQAVIGWCLLREILLQVEFAQRFSREPFIKPTSNSGCLRHFAEVVLLASAPLPSVIVRLVHEAWIRFKVGTWLV